MKRVMLALALAASGAALAQQRTIPGMDIERLALNTNGNGSLVMGNGELTPEGALRANALGEIASGVAITRRLDQVGAVEADRFLVNVAAAYGLTRWLETSLQVPLVLTQSVAQTQYALSNGGLGSPIIAVRVAPPPGTLPFSISGELAISVPIGDPAALGAAVRPSPSARLNFGYKLPMVTLFGELNVVEHPDTWLGGVRGDNADELSDEVGGGLGASAAIPGVKGLSAEAALLVSYDYKHPATTTVLHLGVRYDFMKNTRLFLAAEPGFGSLVGTPVFRLLGGASFSFNPPKGEGADE